jgi:hypothetical protein
MYTTILNTEAGNISPHPRMRNMQAPDTNYSRFSLPAGSTDGQDESR